MNMKKLITSTFLAGSVVSIPAYAASAKFAATYDTDEVLVAVEDIGLSNGAVMDSTAEMDLATIHVANWKELLVGVSAQVNLVTFTEAKGKNGEGTSTAKAEGSVRVGLTVVPEGTVGACASAWVDETLFAHPGPVVFSSRMQELSVTTSLDVVGAIPDVCDAQCIADNLSIEGDVTVALGLDTTAAHHFNFVADDLTSGTYDVIACYDLSALADNNNTDGNAAYAKAALGPRIVTVQEVRATKNGIIDETGVTE
jgi:hypothetical protein